MKTLIAVTLTGLLTIFAGACSSSGTAPASNTPASQPDGHTANHNAAATNTPATGAEDTPANVRAAFPDAQSFTKQHKDITPAQKPAIEKASGGTVPDNDHHSYLAFATTGGARKQIGAATIVKAGGTEAVVIYESREGSPYLKEVRADGLPAAFLAQFKGKGHDDKLTFGAAIKANGADEAAAKALTTALAVDLQTMQALYGASHTH